MIPALPALEAFSDAWAHSIWRASWQGALVLFAAWAACRLLPRLPARVRCWCWRLAFAKLLIGLVWLAPVELPILPPAPDPGTHAIRRNNGPGESIPLASADNSTATPRPGSIALEAAALEIVPAPAGLPRFADAGSTRGWTLVQGLFYSWLGGVIVCLGFCAADWRKVRHWRARARGNRDEILSELVRRLTRSLGVRRVPGAAWSPDVARPLLAGSLRPLILLPESFRQHLSASQLELIVAHELAHAQRRDLLWNILPMLAHAFFFFHPLVWLARREWLLAQEMACDEAVLSTRPDAAPDYGAALMTIIEGQLSPRSKHGLAAVGVAASSHNLKQRLTAMKHIRKPSNTGLALWLLAILTAGIFILIPWKLVAQDAPAPVPTPAPVAVPVPVPTPTAPADPAAPAEYPIAPAPSIENPRSQGEGSPSTMQLTTYHLQYAPAQMVVEMLKPHVDGNTTLVADARSQAVILKATKETTATIARMIQKLDSAEAAPASIPSAPSNPLARAAVQPVPQSSRGPMDADVQREVIEAELRVSQRKIQVAERKLAQTESETLERSQAELELEQARLEMLKARVQLERARTIQSAMSVPARAPSAATQPSNYPAASTATARRAAPPLGSNQRQKVLDLLALEIDLVTGQHETLKRQREAGNDVAKELRRLQHDLSDLQRRQAEIEGRDTDAEAMFKQRIKALEDEAELTKGLIESGRASQSDLLSIRRQILSLQRQRAERGL